MTSSRPSSRAPDPRRVVLLGHRATGKTTLGRIAAELLDWDFVDLDRRIEERTGKAPEVLVAEDEDAFRRIEREQLQKVLDEADDSGHIISPGAGCNAVPDSTLCVWLWRDGWEKTAMRSRARLRPDWSFEREVEWMRSNREPIWGKGAHLFVEIPRGRTPRFAGQMLASYLAWATAVAQSTLAQKTWVVPNGTDQLERAARDSRGFGLAGVEVRSDLFDRAPTVEPEVDFMASLRHPGARWLEDMRGAAAYDVDLRYVESLFESRLLERRDPTTLIVSSHPEGVGEEDVERLVKQATRIVERAPSWSDHLVLKYAPSPQSIDDLDRAVRLADELADSGHRMTFLPQGERFAWTRPVFGHRTNATNYLPVGVHPSRLPRPTDRRLDVPMDLQDWLPHFAKEAPAMFDGLVGDPVDTSMGDWWHTRRARSDDEESCYLKITAGRDLSDNQLQRLLDLLHRFEVRGLSVTSPLKRRIVELVDNPRELEAVNTLRRTSTGWTSTDTDAVGMRATLDAIEQMGISPGTVALIGRGGVTPAVERAIASSDWNLVHQVSARRGWGPERPQRVDLIVNAGGARSVAHREAPDCEVWLDLHYHHVDPPPKQTRVHLNGDTFFIAQAAAQRRFWNESD